LLGTNIHIQIKRILSNETGSERQLRLQKRNELQKRKPLNKIDSEKQIRKNNNKVCQRQRWANIFKPQDKINQDDYLRTFDITTNGGIEEQYWAKANMNKFHKSVQYTVNQCTICQEGWPLKLKPRAPYVFSRCSRDKKSPKRFSLQNCTIP
jgi:hypothetical protein